MNDFQRDLEDEQRALDAAKAWGTLGRFITLGLWSNERRITRAATSLEEARHDVEALNELYVDINRLQEFLDTSIEENGVRIAICVFPDVLLDGRQTYGPLWTAIRAGVLQRDGYTCQHADGCCAGPLQIHHIRWLSKGGTNDFANLVTLCRYHHGLEHPENPTFRR